MKKNGEGKKKKEREEEREKEREKGTKKVNEFCYHEKVCNKRKSIVIMKKKNNIN